MGYLVQHYGDVPQDVLLKITTAETLSDDTRDIVITGMRHLLGLSNFVLEYGDEDEMRH